MEAVTEKVEARPPATRAEVYIVHKGKRLETVNFWCGGFGPTPFPKSASGVFCLHGELDKSVRPRSLPIGARVIVVVNDKMAFDARITDTQGGYYSFTSESVPWQYTEAEAA